MKKSLLSLVVLVSMLFSFQGFSQTPGTLTFSDTLGVLDGTITKDLGDHDVSTDSVNVKVGDTLFYMEFKHTDNTYKYYGIIKSKENLNSNNYYPVIKLALHLEISEMKDTTKKLVSLNGSDFTGIAINPNMHFAKHFIKDTIINTSQSTTTLSFNVLNISNGDDSGDNFKFSFKFDASMYTGIEDNFFVEKETFKVYPNPCENQLNIEADGLKRVFDTSGRLILETYENTVNMSDLAPGMYVVMLESGARAKFVKE